MPVRGRDNGIGRAREEEVLNQCYLGGLPSTGDDHYRRTGVHHMYPPTELSAPLLQDPYQQSTRRSQDTMVLVGIFSRDDQSRYQWLISKVLAFSNVRDVRSVSITNNFQKFQEETFKCDFAILYHSKTRGRVNVTNVTDSLYDEELQYLSNVHGRRNVLVVIDDLDSSGEEQKSNILAHQPSIAELAQDLFLFTSAEKAPLTGGGGGYQAADRTQRALDNMARIIGGCKKRVIDDMVGHPGGGFPGRCRLPATRLCIVITIVVLIVIILIIVLSVSKTHVPGTTAPLWTTVTPSPPPRTSPSHQ